MGMREKLIELWDKAEEHADRICNSAESCEECHGYNKGCICKDFLQVDFLIANGVTIQKWIPVTERLPDEDDYYLCSVKSFVHLGRKYVSILSYDKGGFKEGHIYTDDVTHWMPLPEAPKEDCNA